MTLLKDFFLLLIPAIIIAVCAWVIVKYYLKTEKEKLVVRIGLKNKELVTPVRLQAYERIVLLLERIEASQIVMRNVLIGQTAAQLQQSLVNNIRDEFDHNLSQQLYISSEAWQLIKSAREAAITAVNEAASKVAPDAPASDLAQQIFQGELNSERSQIGEALEFVKSEARLLF
ncbi:MAG: hypothetical protein ACM3ME_01140 [Chloroflexota bacterium]|nr:hypothetical protein [Lentimicrobium sp.]